MKRKILFGVIIIVISSSVGFLGYRTYQISESKKKAEILSQTLPELPFQFLHKISDDSYECTVVNYFSPECSHCQYMAQQLVAHASEFRKTHIFMITPAKLEETKLFANDFGLLKLDFVSIGIDPDFRFYKLFGTAMMPSFFIYGSDKKIIRKFIGETKIENLIITEKSK